MITTRGPGKPRPVLVVDLRRPGVSGKLESLTRHSLFGIAGAMNEKLTANEIGSKGGKSRSAKKLAAAAKNIAKARAVAAEKSRIAGRGLAWTKR